MPLTDCESVRIGTDFQILTLRSGFGKIREFFLLLDLLSLSLNPSTDSSHLAATWLRGKEGSTIQIFNPHMDPEYTRIVRKKNKGKLPKELDCSLDSS